MAIEERNQPDWVRLALRQKGMDALLAGRPVEGEGYFRTALAEELPDAERVGLLVCLAEALLDEGLPEEAEQYLAQALALGDATGHAQGSMADVLLQRGGDPERALWLAEQSFALSSQACRDGEAMEHLRGARLWTRKGHALLQMHRREEAERAVENAEAETAEAHACDRDEDDVGVNLLELLAIRPLRQMESLAIASAHWQIGGMLAALGHDHRAAEHLRIAWSADRGGKYRRLAEKTLDRIGAPAARARPRVAAAERVAGKRSVRG